MIELLATYAHTVWCAWMQYLFSKCILNEDGSMLIPPHEVQLWLRQSHTPYLQLPEAEKNADRDEARVMLGMIRTMLEKDIRV